jgi:hypothetical protein
MAAQHLVGYILLRYKLNLAQGNAASMFYQCQSKCPHRVSAVFVSLKSYAIGLWGIQTFNESHVLHVFQQTVWHYVKNGNP